MLRAASLTTTLFLALSIAASPVEVRKSPITIPISRRLNTFNRTMNILQHDKARVAALKGLSTSSLDRRDQSVEILNEGVNYVTSISIGTPSTYCKLNLERKIAVVNELSYADHLIIDTGSSNTWIGANTKYQETLSSFNLDQPVEIRYMSGDMIIGDEFSDTVNLGGDLVILQQSFCNASQWFELDGVDGVLGLGPVGLTRGTLQNAQATTIPTVTQNLYTQGVISQEVISIYFTPTIGEGNEPDYGVITFGGTDPAWYTGEIAYT